MPWCHTHCQAWNTYIFSYSTCSIAFTVPWTFSRVHWRFYVQTDDNVIFDYIFASSTIWNLFQSVYLLVRGVLLLFDHLVTEGLYDRRTIQVKIKYRKKNSVLNQHDIEPTDHITVTQSITYNMSKTFTIEKVGRWFIEVHDQWAVASWWGYSKTWAGGLLPNCWERMSSITTDIGRKFFNLDRFRYFCNVNLMTNIKLVSDSYGIFRIYHGFA